MELTKHFKTAPSLSEFIDYACKQENAIKLSEFMNMETTEYLEQVSLFAIERYNNFLKQPLELKYLVPCDKEGKPMEEPEKYENYLEVKGLPSHAIQEESRSWWLDCVKFDKALNDCIYEGFEFIKEDDVFVVLKNPNVMKMGQLHDPFYFAKGGNGLTIGSMIGQKINGNYFQL